MADEDLRREIASLRRQVADMAIEAFVLRRIVTHILAFGADDVGELTMRLIGQADLAIERAPPELRDALIEQRMLVDRVMEGLLQDAAVLSIAGKPEGAASRAAADSRRRGRSRKPE